MGSAQVVRLVADQVEAAGVRADTGPPATRAENHIYHLTDGQITELWPAGDPQFG